MKCPNCGTEVGRSPFCPQCGADLTLRNRRHISFVRKLDRRVRHGMAATIIFVAVFSFLMVLISAIPAPVAPEPDPWELPPGTMETGNGSYIVPDDGFRDSFTSEFNDAGEFIITLDQDLSEGFVSFVWEFRNDWTTDSWVITKTSPYLSWMEPDVGEWTVSVFCSGPEMDDAVYEGGLTYLGDGGYIETWMHNGKTLSIAHTVTLEEYISATTDPHVRFDGSLDAATSLVDPDGTVKALEEKIWNTYRTSFAFDRSSSNYASCLIGMVDQCYETRSDTAVHGTSVQWNGPIRTMYMGVGDTGDLAVLTASLLKAAGFDVAIVKMPDEWMVGVSSVLPAESAPVGYTIVARNQGYLLATVDGFHGLGVVDEMYGLSGNVYTQAGIPLDEPYGLRTCRT